MNITNCTYAHLLWNTIYDHTVNLYENFQSSCDTTQYILRQSITTSNKYQGNLHLGTWNNWCTCTGIFHALKLLTAININCTCTSIISYSQVKISLVFVWFYNVLS